MEDRKSKILSKQMVGPNTCCFWVDAPHIAASAWAGEFVMIACGNGSDPLLPRAFTVCQYGPKVLERQKDGEHPEWVTPTSISLLFNADGLARSWLGEREVGEDIRVLGPLGKGFEIHPGTKRIVLAGGGTGIAPLIALADEALAAQVHVTLLSAGRTKAALYPEELIQPELEYVPVTEDGSVGKQGLVTAHLSPYLENADQLFLCGPVPMYKSALPVCRDAKIEDRTQTLLEVRMACGFGICFGCSIPTLSGMKKICTEGPRFGLDEVDWEAL